MPKCDAACQKIIINTGLVAIFAELLGRITTVAVLRTAANDLAAIATAAHSALKLMTDHRILVLDDSSSPWQGCDEAAMVMSWIVAVQKGASRTPADSDLLMAAPAQMHAMGVTIMASAMTLIGGPDK